MRYERHVIDAISEQIGAGNHTANMVLDVDVGLDSLDFVKIVMRLEEKLGVRFEDENWSLDMTIGDMSREIERQVLWRNT